MSILRKQLRTKKLASAAARVFLGIAIISSGLVHSGATPVPAAANGAQSIEPPTWLTNSAGEVVPLSGAGDYGSLKGIPLNRPIVGITPTNSKRGYWMVASDGGIFTFGDAKFLGSTGGMRLNKPIIAMASTPSGNGYWLLASDGGIFTFGDAAFFGSTGSMRLNQPVIAMAPTASGRGYWLIAADGGIFTFGDAAFFGSTGSIKLNRPITAMASTPTGRGYWLTASDGGIFTFGDAPFYGSAGSTNSNSYDRVVAAPDGRGYWLMRNGGDTLAYGSAASSVRPAIGQLLRPGNRGESAVDYAIRRLGTPYVWGGTGPNGYDCSGLTSQAWLSAGLRIPRIANDQYDIGTKIPLNDLRPGDLLFWGPDRSNSRTIDHVGMYVGGGWAINSGGNRVQMRSVPGTSGWMFPYGVRPAV